MKILEFYVSGQTIVQRAPTDIYSGSSEYLYCSFEFDEEWKEKHRAYRFTYNEESYQCIENENGLVKVPYEVIKSPGFFISVGGYSDSSFVPTAGIKVKVLKDGYGDKDEELPEGEEASEGFTAQVLEAVSECNELAMQCADYTQSASELAAASEKATEESKAMLAEILSMPPWEIEPETGKWKKYSPEEKAYIPTDYPSRGEQGEKGEKGDKGEQGDAGAAGYTPQKGIDYWTAEDKEEIRSYVESAILGGAW